MILIILVGILLMVMSFTLWRMVMSLEEAMMLVIATALIFVGGFVLASLV